MKKITLLVLFALVGFVRADADADWREAIRAGAISTNAVLAAGKVFVGGADNVAAPVTVSGDITIATNGVAAIGAAVIVDADVHASAAIVATKLAAGVQTSLGLADTAYQPNATNLLTEGYFDVANTTQLVFIASGVTNVVVDDITN